MNSRRIADPVRRPRRHHRVKRSSKPADQKTVTKRMRQIWAEGAVWSMDFRGDMIREAMRELVADDRYWLDLEKLEAFNRERGALLARLKGERPKQ